MAGRWWRRPLRRSWNSKRNIEGIARQQRPAADWLRGWEWPMAGRSMTVAVMGRIEVRLTL